MKALILAAGLGTRLRPYSRHTPKPLFTINQRPLLDLTIERLHQAGCQAAMINTHYHHTQIESFVHRQAYPLPITTRHEPEILGTGGGIRNMADFWEDGSVIVVNADIVCDIDLGAVYAYHHTHASPVTMVMHDQERFNSVAVDYDDCVISFKQAPSNDKRVRHMAFTGIHVLDRQVLDYLPASGPAHIIDTYQRMLEAGKKIQAYVSRDHYWQDIGTPDSYRSTVYEHMAPVAFAAAFGTNPRTPIECHRLQGDGSDRHWYRLAANSHSLIMADHGLRKERNTQEVDAYVDIGRHLWSKSVGVPRIWAYDRMAGLVFVQDLGERNLQQAASQLDESQQRALYERVIDRWIIFAMEGRREFDLNWTYQTRQYDRQVILDKECRYFVEAFLCNYLGWTIDYDALASEFTTLAQEALKAEPVGLMHRDLQSRNIQIKDERIYFIDFQGARMGPLQYDLASLLIDPYVGLSQSLQAELLAYCAGKLEQRYAVDTAAFYDAYPFCALMRNLQMLGAFSYLSRVKDKPGFEVYIPAALGSLQYRLKEIKSKSMPLTELMDATQRAAKEIHRVNVPGTR